ncbi:hypothetical protein DXG01_011973 [Tephrocybe rancida]|nr:hypothetical protein DXG01_011973 [Tephrocybe rancida]
MERTIGNLGKEIRQPSSPFANLAQRALLRCQMNALVSLCPNLEGILRKSRPPVAPPPRGSPILLHRRDKNTYGLQDGAEYDILKDKFDMDVVRRYGRVSLPNGQIARSVFNDEKHTRRSRISNNVKIDLNGTITFAEVRFYFYVSSTEDPDQLDGEENIVPWALASINSYPDATILADSFNTVWACHKTGSAGLQAFPASSIISLVSMQPMPAFDNEPKDLWFPVEKSSLEEVQLGEFDMADS